MKRGFHPDQCQGQLYRALYVDGFTLVEVTDAMTGLFVALQTITSIEIKMDLGQWRSRKNEWDKEWNIKNGGPSADVHRELLSQPTWFYKGVGGKLAYKPFNLDHLTLSMLPAGLGLAADIDCSRSRHGIATEDHRIDLTSGVDRRNNPCMETSGFDLRTIDPSLSSRNPCHPNWAPQTTFDTSSLSITPIAPFVDQFSLVEGNTIPSQGFFGQETYSPTNPWQGLLTTGPWTTAQSTPSFVSSGPLNNASHLPYTLTTTRGQSNDDPTSGDKRNVYRLARNPKCQVAHPGRVVENAWSAPFQPIRPEPTSRVTPNDLASHQYTGQQ